MRNAAEAPRQTWDRRNHMPEFEWGKDIAFHRSMIAHRSYMLKGTGFEHARMRCKISKYATMEDSLIDAMGLDGRRFGGGQWITKEKEYAANALESHGLHGYHMKGVQESQKQH